MSKLCTLVTPSSNTIPAHDTQASHAIDATRDKYVNYPVNE